MDTQFSRVGHEHSIVTFTIQRGEIIYEPVLLAQLQDGELLLEGHRDPYRKKSEAPQQFVRKLAATNDLTQRIDWSKASQVMSRNEGVAREIGGRAK